MTVKRVLLLAMLLAGCASRSVDQDEPRRLLGREGDVRIDAQMFGERINPGSTVTITYEIHNFRSTPIAYAERVAAADFDSDSRMITVTLGAEVPGSPPLPRLQVIGPGETKSFTTGARMNFLIADRGDLSEYPQSLRIKVNFLSEVEPFSALIGQPERGDDAVLADQLFPVWVEHIESVMTNSVPIIWGRGPRSQQTPRRSMTP